MKTEINVDELLIDIFNNEQDESVLNLCSKTELKSFILEIFNKSVLNNYLNLKK